MLTYQMPPRHDRNNDDNNEAEGNNNIPPSMQQLLATQAQLIQLLTQNMATNNNNPPPPPPQADMLSRFLRLGPPRFSSSSEPIVADDWIRFMSKHLVTVGCSKVESVRFAANLLEGPAASWWENHQVTPTQLSRCLGAHFKKLSHNPCLRRGQEPEEVGVLQPMTGKPQSL